MKVGLLPRLLHSSLAAAIFLASSVAGVKPPPANSNSALPKTTESPEWSIVADCLMIVLPQKLALTVIPDLLDDAAFEKGWQQLQIYLQSGEAKLVGEPMVRGTPGTNLKSESAEELRYATEYEPPEVPDNIPKENAVEFLKNWPIIGVTPTAFQTRNLGTKLELSAHVSEDGQWIDLHTMPEHVRLLRFNKFDCGRLPSGEHLSVEQPEFYAVGSTLDLQLRNGQRVLAGIHTLAGEEGMELFILHARAQRGAVPK